LTPRIPVLILQKKTKKPAPSRPIKKVFFDDPPISDEDEDDDGEAQSVGSNPRQTNAYITCFH
jgi:hypothetical protein